MTFTPGHAFLPFFPHGPPMPPSPLHSDARPRPMKGPWSQINRVPPTACSICAAAHPVLWVEKEAARSGNDHFAGARQFADTGVLVPYYRCPSCGLVFSEAFDGWTPEDFAQAIYNEDYGWADPPFERDRPERNAKIIAGLWNYERASRSVLDWGGGAGRLAEALRAEGFDAISADLFFGDPLPEGRTFGLVCSFEVIEHVPHRDQRAWIAKFAEAMAPDGIGLLGTEWAFDDPEHWYYSPRNGHITVHTPASLALLLAPHGLEAVSLSHSCHLIRRVS